jgi:Flp pilus assembly pilin Flp
MNRETIADLVLLATVKGTMKLKNVLRRLREDVSGQDMIEYALLVGLISLVAVTALIAAGKSVNGIWTTVNASLTTANAAVPAS